MRSRNPTLEFRRELADAQNVRPSCARTSRTSGATAIPVTQSIPGVGSRLHNLPIAVAMATRVALQASTDTRNDTLR